MNKNDLHDYMIPCIRCLRCEKHFDVVSFNNGKCSSDSKACVLRAARVVEVPKQYSPVFEITSGNLIAE